MASLNSLANWVRRRPAIRRAAHSMVRLIPDVPRTVNVRGFGPLRIRLRRHRWFLWERMGEHDALTFGTFDRLIRDGDVVFDIGANIGAYTRVMREWFHAGPMVAFEPMAENVELLEANVRLGAMDQTTVLRMALSDHNGEETLQVDDVTSGTAVLDSVSGGAASGGRQSLGLEPRTEVVAVRRLDDVVAEMGLPAPAMMKIDTEGAEVAVLRGAERTLREHRPRLAIALHGPDKADGTLRLLDELGYAIYGFATDEPGATAWRRLQPGDHERVRNNNIVASMRDEDLVEPIVARRGPR